MHFVVRGGYVVRWNLFGICSPDSKKALAQKCSPKKIPRPHSPANVVAHATRTMTNTATSQTTNAPQGHCGDCRRKHLFQDCPHHPDKKGKAIVNIVEVLPSASNGSDMDDRVPLKVVTRAQAKKKEFERINETGEGSKSSRSKSVRRAIRSKVRAQYHQRLKAVSAKLSQAQERL